MSDCLFERIYEIVRIGNVVVHIRKIVVLCKGSPVVVDGFVRLLTVIIGVS